ncbi:DUF106 domain-containing protein [Candidatus Woesearchaeota archaeon]|nr:DUF106 domain-containing protein [Candidatus Woesearchaeota archaeon]
MVGSFLDPVFSPLLALPSWLAILVISVVITTLTTIAYKYLTDQQRMKALKAEMKGYQKKVKELSKTDPKKAMKVQQEMMGKNMEIMKQSFKPTLYTLIPIIIIFGWLNAHMAYEPLLPGEPFTVTMQLQKGAAGEVTLDTIPELGLHRNDTWTKEVIDGVASWTLMGEEGTYQLAFTHASGASTAKEVVISSETGQYAPPFEKVKVAPFSAVTLSNEKIKPLEGFPLVGNWGWIGIYILFSVALSFGLRKALGVA